MNKNGPRNDCFKLLSECNDDSDHFCSSGFSPSKIEIMQSTKNSIKQK